MIVMRRMSPSIGVLWGQERLQPLPLLICQVVSPFRYLLLLQPSVYAILGNRY